MGFSNLKSFYTHRSFMHYTVVRTDGNAFFLSDPVLLVRETFPFCHAWFYDTHISTGKKAKQFSAQTFRIELFLDFYNHGAKFPAEEVSVAKSRLASLGYEMVEEDKI